MTTQSASDTGSQKITKLGTVTQGTWNASFVNVAYGGSSATSFTAYTPICGGTTSTGSLQSVASLGSSGQVLTSNGAGALPSFQTATFGTTLISSQTASASAVIDFDSLTGYDHYVIYSRNMQPSSDNVNFVISISTDGGMTWKSGASDYQWQRYTANNLSQSSAQDTSDPSIVTSSAWSNAANETGSAIINIIDPGKTGGYATIISRYYCLDSSSATRTSFSGGQYKTAAAINGIRLAYSSGNIATGFFSLYGIK